MKNSFILGIISFFATALYFTLVPEVRQQTSLRRILDSVFNQTIQPNCTSINATNYQCSAYQTTCTFYTASNSSKCANASMSASNSTVTVLNFTSNYTFQVSSLTNWTNYTTIGQSNLTSNSTNYTVIISFINSTVSNYSQVCINNISNSTDQSVLNVCTSTNVTCFSLLNSSQAANCQTFNKILNVSKNLTTCSLPIFAYSYDWDYYLYHNMTTTTCTFNTLYCDNTFFYPCPNNTWNSSQLFSTSSNQTNQTFTSNDTLCKSTYNQAALTNTTNCSVYNYLCVQIGYSYSDVCQSPNITFINSTVTTYNGTFISYNGNSNTNGAYTGQNYSNISPAVFKQQVAINATCLFFTQKAQNVSAATSATCVKYGKGFKCNIAINKKIAANSYQIHWCKSCFTANAIVFTSSAARQKICAKSQTRNQRQCNYALRAYNKAIQVQNDVCTH